MTSNQSRPPSPCRPSAGDLVVALALAGACSSAGGSEPSSARRQPQPPPRPSADASASVAARPARSTPRRRSMPCRGLQRLPRPVQGRQVQQAMDEIAETYEDHFELIEDPLGAGTEPSGKSSRRRSRRRCARDAGRQAGGGVESMIKVTIVKLETAKACSPDSMPVRSWLLAPRPVRRPREFEAGNGARRVHWRGLQRRPEARRSVTVRLGVDVGGTFTKAVAVDARTGALVGQAIVPTSHDAPDGIAAGVVASIRGAQGRSSRQAGAGPIAMVGHSTSLAVNALLEGDLPTVGLVGIGRGAGRRGRTQADGRRGRGARAGSRPAAGVSISRSRPGVIRSASKRSSTSWWRLGSRRWR